MTSTCRVIRGNMHARVGEIGVILENDFDKYDYKVDFGQVCLPLDGPHSEILPPGSVYSRIVYFYKDELEVFK